VSWGDAGVLEAVEGAGRLHRTKHSESHPQG
jgi:hypothetical protein